MIRKYLLPVCLFLPIICLAKHYEFNTNCRNAYEEIFSLRLNSGKALLEMELEENPDNLIPVYLQNYIDFLKVFVSDDEQDYQTLKNHKDKRLSQLKSGDKSSPYYLYTQAEVHLQYGLTKIRFKDYFSGLLEIRRAYKLLEENSEHFPEFLPNQKSMCLVQALVGAVPDKYQWGLRLLGMEGNLQQSLEQLKSISAAAQQDFFFHNEVVNIYASLLLHLQGDEEGAWEVIRQEDYPLSNNLFSSYSAGKIALYSKHNEEAIRILKNAPKGHQYVSFPLLEYYLGIAYLNKLDPKAIEHFDRFISEYKGQDLLKSAYQKKAWAYWIMGEPDNYDQNIRLLQESGRTEVEADQQAQKEAKSEQKPNVDLLKARLLFDGGYYEEAIAFLADKTAQDFSNDNQQLEFIYRQGRIYDEMGQRDKAIGFYEQTIEKGAKAPFYYAANASLNLAIIYESRGDMSKAKHYFNKCIDMDGHEYKNSINQEARAGLERLSMN